MTEKVIAIIQNAENLLFSYLFLFEFLFQCFLDLQFFLFFFPPPPLMDCVNIGIIEHTLLSQCWWLCGDEGEAKALKNIFTCFENIFFLRGKIPEEIKKSLIVVKNCRSQTKKFEG